MAYTTGVNQQQFQARYGRHSFFELRFNANLELLGASFDFC